MAKLTFAASFLLFVERTSWNSLNFIGATLSHPALLVLQFAGCVFLIVLGGGWTWGAIASRTWADAPRTDSGKGFVNRKKKTSYPGVSVIMPLKGTREHDSCNWQSHFTSLYEGELEFIAVVESAFDSAAASIKSVAARFPEVDCKVEVAGFASKCSQKLHNLLHGVSASKLTAKYIFFLDNDVALFENSISKMVSVLEENNGIFAVTGYPFDIPAPESDFLTYCAMAFHLPMMIPFCINRTSFVWGGCMLLRKKDLALTDAYGILHTWGNGGYSDDMLLSAKCIEHGLKVSAGPGIILPQRLESSCSWKILWNYLKRQMFVMDTYDTKESKLLNHKMLAFHVLVSVSVVVSALAGILRLFLWQMDLVFLLTRRVFSSEDASVNWVDIFEISGSMESTFFTLAWVATSLFAHGSLFILTSRIQNHFDNNMPGVIKLESHALFFLKLWIGVLVANSIIPFCVISLFFTSAIVWSDIEYTRKEGKITNLRRLPPELDRSDYFQV